MMITVLILLAATIAILFLVRSLFQGEQSIQRRWEAGIRHVAVAVIALLAFTIMFGLLLVLDLLEKNQLSWYTLANVTKMTMISFSVGFFLLAVSLIVSRKIVR